jgi:hypothetical protein
MENIDRAVLATIGGDVLKPKIIDAVIAGVKDAMEPANITRETAKRKREIASPACRVPPSRRPARHAVPPGARDSTIPISSSRRR